MREAGSTGPILGSGVGRWSLQLWLGISVSLHVGVTQLRGPAGSSPVPARREKEPTTIELIESPAQLSGEPVERADVRQPLPGVAAMRDVGTSQVREVRHKVPPARGVAQPPLERPERLESTAAASERGEGEVVSTPAPDVPELRPSASPTTSPPVGGIASQARGASVGEPAAPRAPTTRLVDPQVLARYTEELRAAVERKRVYPQLARRRHLEGTVYVRFSVASDGRVLGARVARSSGEPTLDEAATSAVLGAAPFRVPPPQIGGGVLSVELPFVFRLKD